MALAFFDFDGTLTRCDSFIPYCLISLFYRPRRTLAIMSLFKHCIKFLKGRINRQELKENFVLIFLAEARKQDILLWNKIFLRFILPMIIRRKVFKRLQDHKQMGDRIFIISASPDIYLKPIVRFWKIDGVLCTTLEKRGGHLTGRIIGLNCRGEEKSRRILETFKKEELKGSFAYGNSEGDRQMLMLASYAFKV